MDSLSPACTPLKQAYDTCFNSWFEGYLQPALDAANASGRGNGNSNGTTASSSTTSTISSNTLYSTPSTSASTSPAPIVETTNRPRPITNWSNAFRSRAAPIVTESTSASSQSEIPVEQTYTGASHTGKALPPIDTRGKTRAQIKAEEYERNCGAVWKQYQTCLQRGIEANTSLSELLNAARTEHPLRDRSNLEGTPWDTTGIPKGAER